MISDSLSSLGIAMANHLWQSTLFALLVGIATLALRKNRARIRYLLWLAASIKFLIPVSALAGLASHLAKLKHTAETQPDFYLVMQRVSQPFHQGHVFPGLFTASLIPLLAEIAGLLWLGGFFFAIGLCCLRWRRVAAAKYGATQMLEGREAEALRRMEQTAGVRRQIVFCSSPNSLEPGVFGIFRPVLLWPAKISEHLEDPHLEAILAHEVQHVRRHDNLTAAMHMVVEAIFWFHPLIWWLGARLLEERERACDEEVLQLGISTQIYAESILKTCKFCVRSPLAFVAGVTGGDLKKRIVRIMTLRPAEKLSLSRKIMLAALGLGAVTAPVTAGLWNAPLAAAQSPQGGSGSQEVTRDHAPQPISSFKGHPVYRVGDGISAPKLTFAPDPQFTELALKAKYQGVCVISTIIDPQGKPQSVKVVRQLGMGLDEKAIEAVRQYQFTPAMLNGKAVAVQVHIEVNFRRW